MLKLIYNAAIYLYGILIYLASFFNLKARLLYRGRRESLQELEKLDAGKVAWFHCSSLGEFEQARPLIETFKQTFEHQILLTFYSPSGYEIRKNYSLADCICYLPHDNFKQMQAFVQRAKPDLFFLIKYDFWLNLLLILHKSPCRLFLVSAIFRAKDIFFRSYGTPFLKALSYFDHIFVQDETSSQILKKHSIVKVTVSGDTRVDSVLKQKASHQILPLVQQFIDLQPVLVLGSVWKKDLEIITPKLKTFTKPLKIILAPHDISPPNLTNIVSYFDQPILKYSDLKNVPVAELERYSILLIDNIGLLAQLYAYADLAYIGGGFGEGTHNTLEPAAYSKPVIIGPKSEKFNEIVDLVNLGGFFQIKDSATFAQTFDKLYSKLDNVEPIAKIINKYLKSKAGATFKVMKQLKR